MPDFFAASLTLAGVFSVAAVFFDLRERRIPNRLNYSFLFLALATAFLAGKLDAAYAVFLSASFVFGYALYKLGVWAGGDVKFFTVLSAFFAIARPPALQNIVLVFLLSAALLIPALAAIHFREFVSLRKEFLNALRASFKPAVSSAGISALVYAAYSVLFSKLDAQVLAGAAGLGFAVAFLLAFFKSFFQVVSQKILRLQVPVVELREGDIPAVSVYEVGGDLRYWSPPSPAMIFSSALRLDAAGLRDLLPPPNPVVDCLAARGVSAEEIKQLKKGRVKTLVVRRSVPFAPALAAGFGLLVLAL